MIRGIRGAITVENNDTEEILVATKELLEKVAEENGIIEDKIASIIFSMTSDLNQVFPAVAARELDWTNVPLFCVKELEIEGALSRCIRILIHYNTDKKQDQIKHIYLKGAKSLRPDLVEEEEAHNGR
ncbi:chorismate mutase [Orenia metallireducens]|uniref:chorismate mutase n=1 Tax=Orenia metallireducens TaxID=1413210 RepID=A0A285HIJ5_9FIRM|nr:chorismate mutase [Orenia metallireducens]PRX27465.1 chorismate mutase [Orenia metallireducens]SNY34606.1 chorismate mutase [Orenia metallireducens]